MKIRGYEGSLNLKEMQTQIRFEEAGALELVDCLVITDKMNQPINICIFNELGAGEVPADIVLVIAKEPKPIGTIKKVLSDTLVINSHFSRIDFYR
jgi:hypothetical protein